jgi:Raf kinase inhibitor-like YbhB/YbcL family protein
MTATLTVTIDGWKTGEAIPEEYAFCEPAEQGHVAMGRNRNPAIRWSGAPAGTRSYAIICHDPDVPSKPDNVNKEGVTVPADLPRVDFFHWVLVDIPAERTGIAAGEDSHRVTPGGKPKGKTDYGVRGINNYTDWFAGDDAMKGDYGGYDGPCPPWNDEIVHHYHFTVFALDVPTLGLVGRFGGAEARAAMQGHVLAEGTHIGTYSLNPALRHR